MFGGKPSNKVKEIWQQIHQQKVTDSNLIETTIKQKETMTGSKKSPTNMDTKTLDQNNQINVDKSTQDINKNQQNKQQQKTINPLQQQIQSLPQQVQQQFFV